MKWEPEPRQENAPAKKIGEPKADLRVTGGLGKALVMIIGVLLVGPLSLPLPSGCDHQMKLFQ